MSSPASPSPCNSTGRCKIAVVGAGWWTQGWHLPHCWRNERCIISAVIDSNPYPTSSLNPNLLSLSSLGEKYLCSTYESLTDFFAAKDQVAAETDGIIVCTPHGTHHELGIQIIEEGVRRVRNGEKLLHVFMEKPMTTSVEEARELNDRANDYRRMGGIFLVNHSANFRSQTKTAREIVQSGQLGHIRLVTALMASPLSWLFDNPQNTGWCTPSGNMLGNGMAWGQSSHILAWIYHVSGISPNKVYCAMNSSEKTGADIVHSATIHCDDGGVLFSLSGTSLKPGYEHSDPPVGKSISIHIFGTDGTLSYVGDDRDPSSGHLKLSTSAQTKEVELCNDHGFLFENTDVSGIGPESLQNFISVCKGEEYYSGADSDIGLKTVQTIEAMYRSHAHGSVEPVIMGVSSPSSL